MGVVKLDFNNVDRSIKTDNKIIPTIVEDLSSVFLIKSKLRQYGLDSISSNNSTDLALNKHKAIEIVKTERIYHYLSRKGNNLLNLLLQFIELIETYHVDYLILQDNVSDRLSMYMGLIHKIANDKGISIIDDMIISPFNKYCAQLAKIDIQTAICAYIYHICFDKNNSIGTNLFLGENKDSLLQDISKNFGVQYHIAAFLFSRMEIDNIYNEGDFKAKYKKVVKLLYKIAIRLNKHIVNQDNKVGISIVMADFKFKDSFLKAENSLGTYTPSFASKIISKIYKQRSSSIKTTLIEKTTQKMDLLGVYYERIDFCKIFGLMDLRNMIVEKELLKYTNHHNDIEIKKSKKQLKQVLKKYETEKVNLLGAYFDYLLRIKQYGELEMWIRELLEFEMYNLIDNIEISIGARIDYLINKKDFENTKILIDLMKKFNFETWQIYYDEFFSLKDYKGGSN